MKTSDISETLMKRVLYKFVFGITAMAGIANATSYTYVPIPTSNNIQTGLISTFPTGTFKAGNTLATPFDIGSAPGTCGPAGNAPCNFYDGFTGVGSSISMNVSVKNPTDVYTLMNAYGPATGQQLASIEFVGTGNTSVTFSLIAGEDIRDFYHGRYANGLNNDVPGVVATNAFTCTDPANCLGAGTTGNVTTGNQGVYVVDEQDFSLGSVFSGQTLTQIVLTDTYSGSVPILLGATVGLVTPAATAPEPSDLLFTGLGLIGLRFLQWRRVKSDRTRL